VFFAEPGEHGKGDDEHYTPDEEIAKAPAEFGHVLEVHAVGFNDKVAMSI